MTPFFKRKRAVLLGTAVLGITAQCAYLLAQTPPSPQTQTPAPGTAQAPSPQNTQTRAAQSNTPPPKRVGGFVPGQKRPPEDPAQVARGKTLFEINCRGCHGADLRGGDLGGPSLLRSQVALSDLHGEKIVPIIHGARQSQGMPAIPIDDADANSVAAYVRSVIATIGVQGTPPDADRKPLNIVVGNAAEGKSYFAAKCASCHSVTGDMQGIATRIPDPKTLQTAWVSGEVRGEQEPPAGAPNPRAITATVTTANGDTVAGQLVHIDDFLVSLKLDDGTIQSFERQGDTPKVEIKDPMKRHREMLPEYTDKDIHDLTAYLVTLK